MTWNDIMRLSARLLKPLVLAGALPVLASGCGDEPTLVLRGIFAYGPVKGLMFQGGRLDGRTDKDGSFFYEPGTTISFSIDGLAVGRTVLAQPTLTPIDLASEPAPFVTSPEVTNMSRFLMSLDDDGDPANGIVLSETMRARVNEFFSTLDFTEENFEDSVEGFFTDDDGDLPLRSAESAQAYLFSAVAENNLLPVDLITLGDGLTAGVQSNAVDLVDVTGTLANLNLHSETQATGFRPVLSAWLLGVANTLADVALPPLLIMDAERGKSRITPESVPANLAVPGATASSLLTERTGSGNTAIDLLLSPIQNDGPKSQLEAAEWVAAQEGHEARMKLITLSIGMNDVLGALTTGGGNDLTGEAIDRFLEEHGPGVVEDSLTETISRLTAIQYSYVFVGTIPDVTRFGALIYKDDLERMARFENPDVIALSADTDPPADEEQVVALGMSAFLDEGIARALSSAGDNDTLNAAILALADNLTLTNREAETIRDRIAAINNHIETLAASHVNVFTVDLEGLFDDLAEPAGILVAENDDALARGFGEGFFSLDGIYPSHTGSSLIAERIAEEINHPFDAAHAAEVGIDQDKDGIGIRFDTEIMTTTVSELWIVEPYRDNDGDGFSAGPGLSSLTTGLTVIAPALADLVDCDDGNRNRVPPAVSGEASCE